MKSLSICLMLVFITLGMQACGPSSKEKVGVEVFSSKLTIRKTEGAHTNSYVMDAHGKIKNTGNVDLKKVVVTGYCRDCTMVLTGNCWFVSDYPKTDKQKDIVSYLPAGAEEDFSFEEIAVYLPTTTEEPPKITNEKIEIVIESYEVVH